MQKVLIPQKFKPETLMILFLLSIKILKNFWNYKCKKKENGLRVNSENIYICVCVHVQRK